MAQDGTELTYTSYSYNSANQMDPPTVFDYDDKGNLQTHTIDSITTSYTWDYLNRLSMWEKTDESSFVFLYNANGMRVRLTEQDETPTTTKYLLDGKEIVEEINGDNVISYVGPGLICKIHNNNRTIYHPDVLGSTRAMTNQSQDVQVAAIYDAYGNLKIDYRAITEATPNFGFVGKYRYYADENGLDYLKARYYDPIMERFISRDPIGTAGGLNLYAYVDANPVNVIDPWGLLGGGFGGDVSGGNGIVGGGGGCHYVRCEDDNGCITEGTVCSACGGLQLGIPGLPWFTGEVDGQFSTCKNVKDFGGPGYSFQIGGGLGIAISGPPFTIGIGISTPRLNIGGCASKVFNIRTL